MRKGKSHGVPGAYHRPRETPVTVRQKLASVQNRSTQTRQEAKNVTLKMPPWEKKNAHKTS